MHNLNIYNITLYKYPKESLTLKGTHCETFACLLIKSEESSNNPTYVIKRIPYNKPEEAISFPIDIGNDNFVSDLEYLTIANSAFLATSTKAFVVDYNLGKVITIQFLSKNHDDKVIAAAWNCEQDSLAVAFNSGRVLVYCMNYHSFELTLLAEDHPDNKGDENVYLGWGDIKKQFKGKGVANYLEENHPPESDYKHAMHDGSISWQLGERYFCVNSVCGEEHFIRVFDNECRLYYTIPNAKIPGICSTTVFRCKRNTLATICQGNEGNTYVVLHERNGGYYNKITSFSNAKVIDIKFSSCGRFFFISSFCNNYYVDVYVQSNFIWSHKFRFHGKLDNPLIDFKCGRTENEIVPLQFIFNDAIVIYEISKSITALPQQHSVFVQTSNNLQLFNYKEAVVPPCGVLGNIITVNDPINYVIPHRNGELLVVIDSVEKAHVFIINKSNNQWESKEIINLYENCNKNNHLPLNWYKFGIETVNDQDYLVAIGLDSENNENDAKFIQCRILLCDKGEKQVTVQNVSKISQIYNTINKGVLEMIPATEKQLKSAMKFDSAKDTLCELYFNGELHINNVLILDGVTSMLNYQGEYLLLTLACTDDPLDRLFCVDVTNLHEQKDNNLISSSWSRRIEKGAILICSANTEGTIVLEIPRGNIELAAIRPIILRNVYVKIQAGKFLEAYHIVRRHAMKLDVLYDLEPELFHRNINDFMKALGSTESIIKFLLPLKNMSTLTQKDFLFVKEHKVTNKKDKICDAIINNDSYKNLCLDDNIMGYRIICIALLVKHNHDPYEALKYLVNLHNGQYDTKALKQLADIVNLLKIYADPGEMYRQALTLYDIELCNCIAHLSGVDPQVYRRFLETCRDSDPVMRRFLMANEGGNYKVAALYLLILYRNGLKTLQEFMEYVKDKNVLEDVYKAMNKTDVDAIERVSQLLIEKYVSNGLFKEAACVLCKQELFAQAIKMLIRGVCWEEAVKLIMYLKELNVEEKLLWFGKVAEACVQHGKHNEAACIYVDHCKDISKAIDCYLEGRLFKEAVCLLKEQRESDNFNKEICLNRLKDLLCENLTAVEANVETYKKNFDLHYERLKIVRENRKFRAENHLDGDDAYSEAGSVTTRSHTSASTITRRTRKLEMKLRSLRHGGKFEDIAIMRELFDIFTEVFKIAEEIHKLYDIYTEYAEITPVDLYNRLGNLQQEMKTSAEEIWLPEFANLDDDVLSADFLTENIVFLDKIYREMPKMMQDESFYLIKK